MKLLKEMQEQKARVLKKILELRASGKSIEEIYKYTNDIIFEEEDEEEEEAAAIANNYGRKSFRKPKGRANEENLSHRYMDDEAIDGSIRASNDH